MTRRWIFACVVLALTACKRDEQPTTTPDAKEDGASTPPADDAATEPEAPADDAVAEVGIPECDRYLRAYRQCVVEHVPAESRDEMLRAMQESAAAWKEAAAGPNRDKLAPACTEAYAAAKEVTAPLGCTFD